MRWVCSGHNGKGADSCPNAVTVDEEELIQALQEYFHEILSKKKKVINYVIKEFQRVYKAKDENVEEKKDSHQEDKAESEENIGAKGRADKKTTSDKTVPNSNNHTQGCRRASSCHQFGACQTGARDTRAKQEREAHPRWTCHQGEISASA